MIWREEGIQASSRGRQSSLDLQLTQGVAGEGLVVQMAILTVTVREEDIVNGGDGFLMLKTLWTVLLEVACVCY